MRMRQFALSMLLLLILVCAACGPPREGSKSNESVRGNTVQACPGSLGFEQVMGTDPTSAGKANIAPPYEEINNKLTEFDRSLSEIYNCKECDHSRYDEVLKEAGQYWHDELSHRWIDGWEGWVVSTGVEALRSMEMRWELGMGLYEVDDDPEGSHNIVLIAMQNPFIASPPPLDTYRRPEELKKTYLALSNPRETSDDPICIGQKVNFEGLVIETSSVEMSYYPLEALIKDASVTVKEDGAYERTAASDLENVVIELRRIPGWFGPDYNLMVFGDGTIVFNGRSGTNVQGFHVSSVSEEIVRLILSEFDKAEFASMNDFDKYEVTDAPYARTTLTRNGNRKSVLHYFGNTMADEKITELENKIDLLVNSDQWIGMCGTSMAKYAPYPCPNN